MNPRTDSANLKIQLCLISQDMFLIRNVGRCQKCVLKLRILERIHDVICFWTEKNQLFLSFILILILPRVLVVFFNRKQILNYWCGMMAKSVLHNEFFTYCL